jgi:hypothetical protein
MSKKIAYFVLMLSLLLIGAKPALADGPPDSVYVDTDYAGNEEGNESKPYNTKEEGRLYLQSLPDGGDLYVKDTDGNWQWVEYVAATTPGGTGDRLPLTTLYLLLAVVTVAALFAGWYFLRKSQQVSR